MARQGRSSKRKGYRGERQAQQDLDKRFKAMGSGLRAFRTSQSGAAATRADGHADPYLQGDIQIRRNGTIVEYIEVKVRDPNAKAGPITIATMDGKNWRAERRILMCRHVPGSRDWLCSMWATTWDDFVDRTGKEPRFSTVWGVTRGVNLHDIRDFMQDGGGLPLRWGSAFYMTIDRLCSMLEDAYGETDADPQAH